MRRIVLDTETTGLDPRQGHRIIELAAIELDNRNITQRRFHRYLNPEREIDAGAVAVHGLTYERLQGEPKFSDVAHGFLEFIGAAELIIHNAPFDMGFLNHELFLLGLPQLTNPVLDTLKMAREMHPGKKNSLDALCGRYEIDNAHRTLHGALLDTELLAEVYLAMTRGQDTFLDEPHFGEAQSASPVMLDSTRPALRILRPNEAELIDHAAQLAAINKASKGACMWLKLESAENAENPA